MVQSNTRSVPSFSVSTPPVALVVIWYARMVVMPLGVCCVQRVVRIGMVHAIDSVSVCLSMLIVQLGMQAFVLPQFTAISHAAMIGSHIAVIAAVTVVSRVSVPIRFVGRCGDGGCRHNLGQRDEGYLESANSERLRSCPEILETVAAPILWTARPSISPCHFAETSPRRLGAARCGGRTSGTEGFCVVRPRW
jgi:hypothetical protein